MKRQEKLIEKAESVLQDIIEIGGSNFEAKSSSKALQESDDEVDVQIEGLGGEATAEKSEGQQEGKAELMMDKMKNAKKLEKVKELQTEMQDFLKVELMAGIEDSMDSSEKKKVDQGICVKIFKILMAFMLFISVF